MFYYTYKITNLINGKIYVGVHKTENLEDGYMGSGKALKSAKSKYGLINFRKVILMMHDSEEEMFEIEALIVDSAFIKRRDVYNSKLGGLGGWDHIVENMTPEKRQQITNKRIETFKLNNAKRGFCYGHSWSDEGIETLKESFAKINHQQGEKNSQFGKMWIHSLEERKSKRINNNEPIPTGWMKGRKMFKN